MTESHHDGERHRRPSWYSGTYPERAEQGGDPRLSGPHQPASYGQPPPYHSPTRHYSPTPGTDELNRMHDREVAQAQSAATAALVLAIIGFFTAPFILGPLAIWQASRARSLGHDASPGLILGWICTLWGAAMIILPFLFFLTVMVGVGL